MTTLKSAVSSRRRGWFLPPFPPFPEHHWYRSASRKFSILCSFRKRRSIVRALTTTGTVAKTSACPAEIHPFSRVEFIWKGYSLILTLNQRLRCSCLVPCALCLFSQWLDTTWPVSRANGSCPANREYDYPLGNWGGFVWRGRAAISASWHTYEALLAVAACADGVALAG